MRIALCLIVQGDSKLDDLKIAVGSADPFVDDVYITTNGKEITQTKLWCEKKGYNHSHLDWDDDFGKQRNFNFAQVKPRTDFIFWMDSDDELVGGEHLRSIAMMMDSKDLDQMFLTYWYGCRFDGDRTYENLVDIELFHQRERLLRPNRIKWAGRIHETPVPFDNVKPRYSHIKHTVEKPHEMFPIAVLHRDATTDNYKRNEERNLRNLNMLEKQLEDEQKANNIDPRTVLYLMKLYENMNDHATIMKCIRLGEQYLQTSGWDEERATAYLIIASCFSKLGEYKRAKNMLFGAMDEYPNNKAIFIRLALISYNLKKYKDMKVYMDMADNVEIDESTAGNRNVLNDKYNTQMLRMYYYLNVAKDIQKAYKASKRMFELQPSPETELQMLHLQDGAKFNEAAKNIHSFVLYLDEANLVHEIGDLLKSLPLSFKKLPIYNDMYNRFGEPRKWKDNEICYFANLGGDHFEKWDASNLKKGMGGSETAVVRLANEWTKLGYKVTIYGDPNLEGEIDGVKYLHYKRFNPKDRFNIFIQWRSGFLANKITTNKFFVDLHDVWNEVDYLDNIEHIDKIFVKSNFHKNLSKHIPDDKFVIISNGI